MTDGQYLAWLADLNAERIVLAELHHAHGVQYVATGPYMSLPGDSDPNRPYDDILKSAVDITTRIDGLTTFGEVALIDDGSITDWLSHAWEGHKIRVFIGAPEWSRDDFRLLATGRNGGITEACRGKIVFRMNDESSVLDERIDTGELPDDAGPVPLALGSIFNAPAYRISTETLTYRASFLPVTSIRAKDAGAPVSHTTDTANGTITLAASLVDTLTVDIEEPHNTPSAVIEWIANYYGISIGTIEMPSYQVGLYYNSDVTGSQILDDLCAGLGAYWFIDQVGALVVRQHSLPTVADVTIVGDDIRYDQVSLSETEPPWRGLTLRWGHNYSPLSTIAGEVDQQSPDEATRLRTEWRESRATQSVDDYPLAEHVTRDSVIQNADDAAIERDRLLALRVTRREIWDLEASLAPVEVGQAADIQHRRLAGRLGRLISVGRSLPREKTNLGVWV
ncbi:hypothetical protein LMS44_18410 [Halomonas profundus]|nr:hypothetical protein LMS44_18410 [Halomonas profundus]